ncbi:MAG: hypothetical protein V4582_09450 [Pseudomonadota bacterium]
MGWKDALSYARGVAHKHGVDAADAPQDAGLPLGARIGAVVTLQQSPLIRANANGSLIGMLDAGDTRIVAVSQLKLDLPGRLFRYYLATGDIDAKEKFLQVYRDGQGKVAEILYCTQLARIIPQTAEDQEAYTGEAGFGLGDRSYTLWREQLVEMGLDESDLAQVFGEGDHLDYQRGVGERHVEFMAPFTGTETRIDDAGGMHGLKQDLYLMPYVRELAGGGSETLLITTEIVASIDGDASRRGIHVDFVIGIPLEQERLVIQ